MKTAVVLILAILFQTAGDVLLTKGMKSLGEGPLFDLALRGAQSPTLWAGTALLLGFFVLYSAALSWADLSFVLPVTAFGYVLHVAGGYYFLNESVKPTRWAGAVVIMLGVCFVSRSRSSTAGTVGRAPEAARGAR